MAAPNPPTANVIHAKMQFKQMGYGWSESFYTTGGLQSALDDLKALATARDAMLGTDGRITRIGVKFMNIRNASESEGFVNGDNSGQASDWPWSAILAELTSDPAGGFYRRSYLIRGTEYGADDAPPDQPPHFSAVLEDGVQTFEAVLTGSRWCIRSQDQGVAGVPILSVAQTMSADQVPVPKIGQVTITTGADHGVPVGTAVYAAGGFDHSLGDPYHVLVEKLKWLPPPAAQPSDVIMDPVSKVLRRTKRINGRKRVIAAPTSTTLVVAGDYQPGTVLLPGGTLRIETFTYPVIAALNLLRSTKRNTGRGSGKPRAGKRRVRVFAP